MDVTEVKNTHENLSTDFQQASVSAALDCNELVASTRCRLDKLAALHRRMIWPSARLHLAPLDIPVIRSKDCLSTWANIRHTKRFFYSRMQFIASSAIWMRTTGFRAPSLVQPWNQHSRSVPLANSIDPFRDRRSLPVWTLCDAR